MTKRSVRDLRKLPTRKEVRRTEAGLALAPCECTCSQSCGGTCGGSCGWTAC